MTQSNDKIKGPVRASKHTPIYVLDADGSFLFPVYDRAERDELIHKHNGYGVAVKALKLITRENNKGMNWPTFARLVLKDLGELDGNDRDTNQALRRDNETSSQEDNTSQEANEEAENGCTHGTNAKWCSRHLCHPHNCFIRQHNEPGYDQ